MYEITHEYTGNRETKPRTSRQHLGSLSEALSSISVAIPSYAQQRELSERLDSGEVLSRTFTGSAGTTVVSIRKVKS